MRKGLIHVGAYDGREYLDCHDRPLLLFEPQRDVFEMLQANFEGRENARLVRAAAGPAVRGDVVMHRVDPAYCSSLLEPGTLRDGFVRAGESRVPVTTVDAIVGDDAGLYEDLVIDTQGYELEVLKGAERTLKDLRSVQIEVHDPVAYPAAASAEQVDEFLTARGFVRTVFCSPGLDDLADVTYERAGAQLAL